MDIPRGRRVGCHPTHPGHGARGQASVELVALVPALLMLALIGWQVAVAAHAWLAAGGAARAGARAEAVGAPAADAARLTLAGGLADSSVIELRERPDGARVHVSVRIPAVLPWLPDPGRASAAVTVPPTTVAAAAP